MKRLHKRILTVCLALMMSVVMAAPTFADWHIQVDDNSNRYINIAGELNTSVDQRYLTLYRTTAPNSDQTFKLMRSSSGFKDNYVLCASANYQYAMNRNSSNGRAWMWALDRNGYGDSRLRTPEADSSTLLVSYSYGAIGAVGSNLYFGQGLTHWFASGTPVFPLGSNVEVNPYI